MELEKQAVDLSDLAIGLVVLGIVVTVGAIILTNMRDARLTDLDINTIANETVDITGDTFSTKWFNSVTECINASDGAVIGSGNYTVSVNDFGVGSITNATETFTSNANCSYTYYDITRADWSLADSSASGIAEYGNWFNIIVIVGVAAVVLSLIFMAFGRSGRESSVNY
jgi:hypothetical protein